MSFTSTHLYGRAVGHQKKKNQPSPRWNLSLEAGISYFLSIVMNAGLIVIEYKFKLWNPIVQA
jgi:hypothetical protein